MDTRTDVQRNSPRIRHAHTLTDRFFVLRKRRNNHKQQRHQRWPSTFLTPSTQNAFVSSFGEL
jgi:hypothetical protein